jgi:hypothetical protein
MCLLRRTGWQCHEGNNVRHFAGRNPSRNWPGSERGCRQNNNKIVGNWIANFCHRNAVVRKSWSWRISPTIPDSWIGTFGPDSYLALGFKFPSMDKINLGLHLHENFHKIYYLIVVKPRCWTNRNINCNIKIHVYMQNTEKPINFEFSKFKFDFIFIFWIFWMFPCKLLFVTFGLQANHTYKICS